MNSMAPDHQDALAAAIAEGIDVYDRQVRFNPFAIFE